MDKRKCNVCPRISCDGLSKPTASDMSSGDTPTMSMDVFFPAIDSFLPKRSGNRTGYGGNVGVQRFPPVNHNASLMTSAYRESGLITQREIHEEERKKEEARLNREKAMRQAYRVPSFPELNPPFSSPCDPGDEENGYLPEIVIREPYSVSPDPDPDEGGFHHVVGNTNKPANSEHLEIPHVPCPPKTLKPTNVRRYRHEPSPPKMPKPDMPTRPLPNINRQVHDMPNNHGKIESKGISDYRDPPIKEFSFPGAPKKLMVLGDSKRVRTLEPIRTLRRNDIVSKYSQNKIKPQMLRSFAQGYQAVKPINYKMFASLEPTVTYDDPFCKRVEPAERTKNFSQKKYGFPRRTVKKHR